MFSVKIEKDHADVQVAHAEEKIDVISVSGYDNAVLFLRESHYLGIGKVVRMRFEDRTDFDAELTRKSANYLG